MCVSRIFVSLPTDRIIFFNHGKTFLFPHDAYYTDMGERPQTLGNRIYPVIPGLEIELGEYGEWKDGAWCPQGNIVTDFGPICFAEKNKDLDQEVESTIGVGISVGLKGDVSADGNNFESTIKFDSDNSIYFKGLLKRKKYYPSINAELLPHLKNLYQGGLWDKNWWVAVEIYYSDSYLILHSRSKGGLAKFGVDLNKPFSEVIGVSANASFEANSDEVSKIMNNGDKEVFVGVRFVSLSQSGILSWKKWKIVYNGTEVTMEMIEDPIPPDDIPNAFQY